LFAGHRLREIYGNKTRSLQNPVVIRFQMFIVNFPERRLPPHSGAVIIFHIPVGFQTEKVTTTLGERRKAEQGTG
jgi:hypothetical protein